MRPPKITPKVKWPRLWPHAIAVDSAGANAHRPRRRWAVLLVATVLAAATPTTSPPLSSAANASQAAAATAASGANAANSDTARAATDLKANATCDARHELLLGEQSIGIQAEDAAAFTDSRLVAEDFVDIETAVLRNGIAHYPLPADAPAQLTDNNRITGPLTYGVTLGHVKRVRTKALGNAYSLWRIRNFTRQDKPVEVEGRRANRDAYRFIAVARSDTYVLMQDFVISSPDPGFKVAGQPPYSPQRYVQNYPLVPDPYSLYHPVYLPKAAQVASSQRAVAAVVLSEGVAQVAYSPPADAPTDAPTDALPLPTSGLALAAAGVVRDWPSGQRYSVWRVRNTAAVSQEVRLRALGEAGEASVQTLRVAAHSDTFIRSAVSCSARLDGVWVGHSEGVLKLLTDDGHTALTLTDAAVEQLAVQPLEAGVWTYSPQRLQGYTTAGKLEVNVATPGVPADATLVQLAAANDRVWLATADAVFVFDTSGKQLHQVAVAGGRAAALDTQQDELWVATATGLTAIDRDGKSRQVATYPTDPSAAAGEVPLALAFDAQLAQFWLGGAGGPGWLRRYTRDGTEQLAVEYSATDIVTRWLRPDGHGGVWVGNATDFGHVDSAGNLEFSQSAVARAPTGAPLHAIVGMVAGAEVADGPTVWVANETTLTQYDLLGTAVQSIAPSIGTGVITDLQRYTLSAALALPPPEVDIVAPQFDARTQQTRPPIELALNVGIKASDIQVTLNDQVVATECVVSGLTATCTPPQALTDARWQVAVTVTDSVGRTAQATTEFMVDTQRPRLAFTAERLGPYLSVDGQLSEPGRVVLTSGDLTGTEGETGRDGRFTASIRLPVGAHVVAITAIDRAGNTYTRHRSVVIPANQPPVITSQPPLTARVGEAYTYPVQATDADGDTLTYVILEQPPKGLQLDASTGVIRWTPQKKGTYRVSLWVFDGYAEYDGKEARQQFTLRVGAANQAPQITSSPGLAAVVDAAYTYNVIATDSEDAALRYALTDAPVGMRIDAQTGALKWQPSVAGPATVTVTVTDPQGNRAQQAFTLQVAYATHDQPPVFAPVAAVTAPLGQTTRVTIRATDPQGQAVTYRIAPLPLPQGAQFDQTTGAFTYHPQVGDVGTHAFTISASDGRFSAAQALSVTVPKPGGPTSLRGRTQMPDGTPLQNVRFAIGGREAFSDANGDFLIDNIPKAGRLRFIVDASGVDATLGSFATIPERFDLVAGTENHLPAPVYLMPLDTANADYVDPYLESEISSADVVIDGVNYGPITITVPPRSATMADSDELYEGLVSISRIPDTDFGPAPMPPDLDLSLYIAVQPFGVKYVNPAEVSFPNVEGFEPNTIVDIFGLNHDTGRFEKVGQGQVSADGRRVDSIGGAVLNNSWHGFVPQPPTVVPPPGPDCGSSTCKNSGGGGGGPGGGGGMGGAGSSYELKNGNFSEEHQLAPYYARGQSQSLRLEYNANWANPRPVVNFRASMGLPAPAGMATRLTVGGLQMGAETFFTPAPVNLTSGTAVTPMMHQASQFDAHDLASGMYPYTYTLNCYFPISRRAATVEDEVMVVNQIRSPFGAGWSLAEWSALYINAERSQILWVMGNGQAWQIERLAANVFRLPTGFYATMTETGASYRVQMQSGTTYTFDSNGRLLSRADRNGNTTTYDYDIYGKLTARTDPAGLVTRFEYVGQYLQRIIDPAGRVTRFEHDRLGNLVTITDPDDSQRRFEYDAQHLLVAKLDKRGHRTTIEYGRDGRYRQATLPDGSSRQALPQDVQGLASQTESAATRDDPAAALYASRNN